MVLSRIFKTDGCSWSIACDKEMNTFKRLFQQSISLVDQNVSVSGLAVLHVNNSLVRLLHWSLLDPRLNLLVNSELKHLLNIFWRSNCTTTNLDTSGKEGEGVDWREVTTIRGAGNDQSAFDFWKREIRTHTRLE